MKREGETQSRLLRLYKRSNWEDGGVWAGFARPNTPNKSLKGASIHANPHVDHGRRGRDFHNFNVFFRDNPDYEVVAFTATQIPNIEGRQYPPNSPAPGTRRASPSIPRATWSS